MKKKQKMDEAWNEDPNLKQKVMVPSDEGTY